LYHFQFEVENGLPSYLFEGCKVEPLHLFLDRSRREHLTLAAKLEIGVRSQESGARRKEEEGRRKEPEEVFLQI